MDREMMLQLFRGTCLVKGFLVSFILPCDFCSNSFQDETWEIALLNYNIILVKIVGLIPLVLHLRHMASSN